MTLQKSGSSSLVTIGRILFALSWIGIAIQHFMYADFVATLVPSYMPKQVFWAWFTGAAMIAAGIAFILNFLTGTAALFLGIMLILFILQIHVPLLISGKAVAINYTRALQDVAIAGAAFTLTGKTGLVRAGRVIYALPLLVLGAQHFLHLDFLTARVPPYFPAPHAWDYLLAFIIIGGAISILVQWKTRLIAFYLGVILLAFALLLHVPPLVQNIRNAQQWTAALLDLAIAAAPFIIAGGSAVTSFTGKKAIA